MGKAARWLRNLLGGGGKKEQGRDREQRRPASTNNGAAAAAPNGDRKRWSFCKSSSRDTSEPEAAQAGANNGGAAIARAAEAAWLRSLYKETEREQSKHAIAVAAATAVAADAAVAAAQAAVEVVRLTSQGPLLAASPRAFAGAGEDGPAAAAVKIQTAFRGYLAKKALRALKALVKLQALVRGYLVRKQAAATLQSMQALVRAQASIRAAARSRAADLRLHHLHPLAVRPPRYSLQEDTRSEHGGVAPCYYYGRRMSASVESSSSYGYDRSPKIVEMDTARPKSRSSSLPVTEPGDDYAYYSVSSPLVPCGHGQNLPGLPPRIAAPSGGFFLQDYEREKPRPATAQSTPRCASSLYYTPVTPAKSVCGVGGYSSNSPSTLHSNGPRSYMSSTQSSDAKARSQSAPKQRPDDEPAVVLPRKRVPLSEVVLEARASLSGGTQRHCYYSSSSCNNKDNNNRQMKAEEAFSFKKAVVSRFDRSSEPADRDRDLFLRKGW